MVDRLKTLRLYKDILRAAKGFPSIKKQKIIVEIREGFRDNRTLADGSLIQQKLSVAEKGLEQLSMYSNLPKSSNNWAVQMEKQPMPKYSPST